MAAAAIVWQGLCGVALAMGVAMPAFAAQWHVDPVTSKLMFSAEQAGETFSGSFPQFSSTIYFDEAAPEKGRIHIAVSMNALQVEGKDRLEALPTEDWLAAKKFPFAEFTSEAITKTGEHQFVAKGRLSIRGVVRDMQVPFALKTKGKSTVATGGFTLSRKDFGIGQGRWASDEWVKYPVRVTYEIHATEQ